MSALADRPHHLPMRLHLDGLSLVIGPSGSADGYKVTLDVDQARHIAAGLLVAADRAERDAAPALDDLARICCRDLLDGDHA